jgi:cation diffusion facilitator family transporter
MAGSLALLADAGHMVSDAAALGMSWAALRLEKRAADAERTYGYKRLEVLVAFVNGCTLFVIAGWIVFEAIRRFAAPVEVLGGTMLVVAIAGLLANVVAFLVLNGGNRENLNVRSRSRVGERAIIVPRRSQNHLPSFSCRLATSFGHTSPKCVWLANLSIHSLM